MQAKTRTAIIFTVFAALVGSSLAAPALQRTARQTTQSNETMLMEQMRSGLRVLAKYLVSLVEAFGLP